MSLESTNARDSQEQAQERATDEQQQDLSRSVWNDMGRGQHQRIERGASSEPSQVLDLGNDDIYAQRHFTEGGPPTDGTVVTTHPDGTVDTLTPDGVMTSEGPGRPRIFKNPNTGEVSETDPVTGTITDSHPTVEGGRITEVRDPNGTLHRITPDGDVVHEGDLVGPDGEPAEAVFKNRDGTSTVVPPDGEPIDYDRQGRVIENPSDADE